MVTDIIDDFFIKVNKHKNNYELNKCCMKIKLWPNESAKIFDLDIINSFDLFSFD